MSDRIVQENARLDGVAERSYWDAAISDSIEGFATDFSVNAGQAVNFKINVNGGVGDTLPYKIEIFRLGYYGGSGAREVAEMTNSGGTVQAAPLFDESRGLVDAGNWLITDSWEVPADAVSGVYLAKLQRLDADGNPIDGATNQVPFVVRNDGVEADIVLQTSDTTWQAYNGWAGNNGKIGPNFYGDPANMVDHEPVADPGLGAQDRAYAVSYNRPFLTRDGGGAASGAQDYLFGADYGAVSWLEKNGYDVSYISGVDTDRLGADYLQNYKAFISVGHDEYWSGDQRVNVEAARDAGVNVLFWSGNEVYWKTRWETAISDDGTAYRTLVCYKETWANRDPNAGPEDYANIDPSNIWTGTWRDVRFLAAKDADGNYIAGGADPDPISGLFPNCHCAETMLTGQLFGPDGTGQFGGAIDVPTNYGNLRVWRNTEAANSEQDIAPGILGYEWDVTPDDANRPGGLIKLSESTLDWNGILVDQGNRVEPGTATHNLTLYRAPSGALVFASGTVFWSWGLSDEHDSSPYGANIESATIKQFSVNLFADMGIQPASLEAGLVGATQSADATPASITINDMAEAVNARAAVTITGTATDDDGNPATADGEVALVELSFDGGATWKAASGTTDWSYVWRPTHEGDYTIKARAVDDSLNVYNATPDEEMVTVTAPVMPGGVSLFDAQPVSASTYTDNQPLELGMRFSVDRAGNATQLRYYRNASDSNDTDVRDGHLWRASDGALLATVTFISAPGESGWQYATLTAPVALTPGDQYITSYHTADNYVSTNGFFDPANEVAFDSLDDDAFTDPYGVISAPEASAANGNGVYRYGDNVIVPRDTFSASNYWVDLTFDPADGNRNSPPVVTSGDFTIAENQTAVGMVTASDPDGNAIVYAIVSSPDAGLFQINSTTGALAFKTAPDFEAPGDAGANNLYNITVSATDNRADPVTKAIVIAVSDVQEPSGTEGQSTLFDQAPTTFTSGNTDPVNYELGTKFISSEDGSIGALRYYRGSADADDTDARTLRLWDANGSVLGSVAVTATPGQTGWQVGALTTPITLTAGQTYIVSYGYVFDNGEGNVESYAATSNYFVTSHTGADGILTAPGSSAPSGGSSGGVGNGLYSVGNDAPFPTQSFNAANYWVDVVFQREGTGDSPNKAPTGTATAVLPAGSEDIGYVVSQATLLAGFSDLDGGTLTVANLTANHGMVANAGNGAYTVTPTADYNGPIALSYTVEDGQGGSVSASQSFTLAAVNDAPDALTLMGGAVAENAAKDTVVGIATSHDVDTGDTRQYSLTDTAGGRFAIGADTGHITVASSVLLDYEKAASHQIKVKVTDGSGKSYEQAFAVQLINVAEPQTLTGTSASETLIAKSDDNYTINGLGGNDTITSLGGADVVRGNAGDDVINTGAGNDVITFYQAADGFDQVDGGEGNDRINALAINTVIGLKSFTGIELISANGYTGVKIQGSALADTLDFSGVTLDGIGRIDGGSGNDHVMGSVGADVIGGGIGDDVLAGGAGSDVLSGGTGNDVFIVDDAGDTIVEAAGSNGGADTVRTSLSTYTLDANVENLIFTGGTDFSGNGNALSNGIAGGGGNDHLVGAAGNDTLDGGVGSDVLDGGAGNDIFVVDSASDIILETAGSSGGTDTVKTTLSNYALGANLENLVFNGSGSFTGTGNTMANSITSGALDDYLSGDAGNDVLTGGGGDDTLDGGAGNDTLDGGTGTDQMTGGAGNDSYIVDSVGDTIVEAAGTAGGTDTIKTSLNNYTLADMLENLTATAAAAFTGTGNRYSNVITGNADADTLNGLEGNDTLTGGAGKDVLDGGTGNDKLDGGTGADQMTGGTGNDSYVVDNVGDTIVEAAGTAGGVDNVTTSIASYTLAAELENLTGTIKTGFSGTGNQFVNVITGGVGNDTLLGLDGADTLSGSTGNDKLNGGAGDDKLDGGTGADEMIGGTGNDSYIVDNASDTIVETAGSTGGVDTVTTSLASYTLAAELENLTGTIKNAFTGTGNGVANKITGGAGPDTLFGLAGNDMLVGGASNDVLSGGDNDDQLTGGAGSDILTGGMGTDTFIFAATSEFGPTSGLDRITDFISAEGDKINLTGIDAGSAKGDQAFAFIGVAAFTTGTHAIGELRYQSASNGDLLVQLDTTRDGVADFSFLVHATILSATDFFL